VCWTAEGNRIHDVIACDIRPDADVVDLQRAAPDKPPKHFNANAAWLVCAAIAHNLTRAAGALAPRSHARARTGTIRTQLINIPARLARSAHRLVLHLPRSWPWQPALNELFHTRPL